MAARVIVPAPVFFGFPHELRDTSGHDGKDREPLQAAGVRLPVERDLRRARELLGLRSARRRAQAQRQRGLVARQRHVAARTWSASTARSSCTRGCGRRPGTSRASPTRWSTARSASSASAPISSAVRALPRVRRRAHRGAPVQPDVQDLHGAGRGHRERRLSAARDRAGHLRQLPERAERVAPEDPVRHRADRQVVPQRDHARQLPLPHARVRADGDRVLREAGRGRALVRVLEAASASPGTSATASGPSACACASTAPTSSRTTPRAAPTSSTSSRSAGRSSKASPTAATST